MRAQEVVMGHNESCEGNSAVVGFKAATWADVELECSVKAFNELFKWPEDRRFFIEILQTDDLTMFNAREFFGTLSV